MLPAAPYDADRARAALLDDIDPDRELPLGIRDALLTVPRERFIPDRAWARVGPDGRYAPIDRQADPDTWWRVVHSDSAIVVQFDDGHTAWPMVGQRPTSSSPMPSVTAAMLAERDTRTEVATALGALSTTASAPGNGRPLTVGELARRLGVHPATLRTWETEGILRPERDRATGYRQYGPDCVRDAEIARQLRRGGYPLRQVAQFVASLLEAGGADALRAFLDSWQDRLTTRSRDLLAGAAQLNTYLTLLDQTEQGRAGG